MMYYSKFYKQRQFLVVLKATQMSLKVVCL